MNRGWMYCLEPMSDRFVEGTDSFVKAAMAYSTNNIWDDEYIY